MTIGPPSSHSQPHGRAATPRRLAAVAAALLAVVLGACSSAPATQSGGSGATSGATIPLLRIGLSWDTANLDQTKDLDAVFIDSLGLDTLLKIGPQGQVEPDLATSWAQTSPVTYVYHIRHGVKFWDGHPLTAADVAYSLTYEGNPKGVLAYAFPGFKSAVATDPYTVTVTLTQPEADWLDYTGAQNAYVFEKQFTQAHKATFGQPGTLVMGSGPWEFDSLDPTKDAELTANPHWWGGKVPIQHVSMLFYSNETSLALAFRAGEVDLTPYVGSPNSFKATSGATLLSTPSCHIGFFGMNTTQPGWNDVHVRRAVAYALNRTGPLSGRQTAFSGSGCIVPDPSVEDTWLGSTMLQPGGWNFAEYAPSSLDALLSQGLTTSTPAERFAVYAKVFRQLQDDVPYVGLYASDLTAAVSKKFTWSDYSAWSWNTPYVLGVKPAA